MRWHTQCYIILRTCNKILSKLCFGPVRSTAAMADYAFVPGQTLGVSVDLALGLAADGLGGTDTLVNITGVRSTSFADTLLAESDAHITIVDRHGKPGGTGTMPIPSSHCTSRRPSTA